VAIKALRGELIDEMPELLERFQREGEILRQLNHPNIVKVLAAFAEQGQHYMVMEYVGGGSLADLISRPQPLPIQRVAAIALELADALSRAHHLNVLHRDLKPANVLLAEDGTPRLSDFGLARPGNYPRLTEAGSILGTFHYLSPEAWENQKLDERADIWSFGVVLYEMLTKHLPFNGDSPYEIMWAVRNLPLPDPLELRPDIPPELAALLYKMLQRDRLARLASARQVGAELELIQKRLARPEKPARPPLPTVRPRQPEAAARDVPVQKPDSALPQADAAQKIRLLLVDDHAVVRQGLRTLIELQSDMTVVGEAADGAEGVELAGQLQPDVVLLDLVMPQMDGVEATQKILERSRAARVLILTSFGEDDKVFPAIQAGAQGYLLKDIQPDSLIRAVREAHQGKVQLHPQITSKLMSAVSGSRTGQAKAEARPADASQLTERELQVLRRIAGGLSNHEIAEQMFISERTVKTHVSNILGKLNLADRTQAAIWALKHGLETAD
jgi:DNA-binding NarL/FixJ family response regulator